jgi:wyosine [tRNA(Phe)-imidazoG37] synthetase (radical SAM superfamily)
MLVKGINDSSSDIRALERAIARIQPDKVQLNTVVRPPAEKWARPLSESALNRIKNELGDRAEVVVNFPRRRGSLSVPDIRKAILSMAERRPVTLEDITSSLGRNKQEVLPHLETLLHWQKISRKRHEGAVYYATTMAARKNNASPARQAGRTWKRP